MSSKHQHRRFLGYLKTPHPANDREWVYKIVIDEIRNQGVYVYLYLHPEAVHCSYDHWHPDIEDAFENWQDEITEEGWIPLPEPPSHAHDLRFCE